jgi:3',5'-cyclic AMP phosphodiesterase CpdA
MRLAPFTLPRLLTNALAGVAQLGDQTGLLVFGEGTGDLAHHLARRVVARGQIISRGRQQPHPSTDEERDAQLLATKGFTFLQISDSHVGFNKAANPHALDTLKEAIDRVKALPAKPAFMLHTGDITHSAKPAEYDGANQIIGSAGLNVHYVPGEHDITDEATQSAYLERYGKGTKGGGWYSFDQNGVHFIGLNNVTNLKAAGLGFLGNDQLEWLEDDLKALKSSTPIVVFAHIPLWSIYPSWGWGTDDSAIALGYLKRFGSVTVLNGHIHQLMQKVEGNVTFHTARSTAFPQPAPGTAPAPGPMVVPADKLRSLLGITEVKFRQAEAALAITDTHSCQPRATTTSRTRFADRKRRKRQYPRFKRPAKVGELSQR